MISPMLVKDAVRKSDNYFLSEDEKIVYDREHPNVKIEVAEIVDDMRKKHHCDFECIFYEHGTLTAVLQCRQCGAVIFTSEDEDYDPNLECPCCGQKHKTDKTPPSRQ